MKLVSKTRHGARVAKTYDVARTPYRRLLASPEVSEEAKAELTRTYLKLNPVELKRQIAGCQSALLRANRNKPRPGKEVRNPPDHPFRETFSWREASRTFSMRQPMGASRTS